ncbi:MAG: esterase-like of phytase family protein [Alphaproteobacteria bacterium]|nr:esterase-like of phytase family protein [Alphaproteobacteria bacterium]
MAFPRPLAALRILILVAALFFVGPFAPHALLAPSRTDGPATIIFKPVGLDSDDPARTRLGALTFLHGWSLDSPNLGFGGISALHVDGRDVTALSDAGALIRFALPPGMPAKGIFEVRGRIDPLPVGLRPPVRKRDRDTESMALSGGHAWIGLEWRGAIWRYAIPSWRSDAHQAPAAMRKWPNNSGAEGLVRLQDGRFLVLSEAARRSDGTSEVLLFDGDPALRGTEWHSLGYRAPAGYRLTDAAVLPDGRLLLLNRRFTLLDGMSAKLVLASLPQPGEAGVIAGAVIADFQPPVTVDNMEALSLTREHGRTIVWIASDDNFSPLQRTLLLKFVLNE